MIRRATMGDLDSLVEIGRDIVAESPEYEGLTFDDDRLRNFLRWSLGSGDGNGNGAAFISELPQRSASSSEVAAWFAERGPDAPPYPHVYTTTGAIVVFVSNKPAAAESFVGDLGLFIRKPHRKGRLARELVLRVEDWMREEGHTDIQLGITTGIHMAGTSLLYESLGYVESGRIFRKRLEG